jgi:hypothetical protein
MHRIRIRIRHLVVALVALGLSAGFVAAHALPAASDGGIQQAQSVSGKAVPMAADASNNEQAGQDASQDAGTPPADTHGATVAAAAQSPTPDGFDNHGAYVSSIATGWGQQTADAHKNAAATGDTPPATADKGLAHQP